MEDRLREVARHILQAQQVVALTGAGISVESGIPAFRGSQGLWSRYDPMEYASIEAFREDPVKVWDMLTELDTIVRNAKPNPAHAALARLEAMGRLAGVVTQNIDGLHQAAGSRQVIEFHGSGRRLVCVDCQRVIGRAEMFTGEMPPRCACGGLIKPDVVFFGEPIPQRAAMTAMALAASSQVVLVVGTSAMVAPASHLPVLAKQSGATVVEINPEPTALSEQVADYSFHHKASRVLPALVEMLEELDAAQI